MDVALIHNPKAGRRSHSADEIDIILRKAGYRAKYWKIGDAMNDPAAFEHGAFVVVAGGDGSIRKAALKTMGSGRVLAPLPLGTANNIAHSLGIKGRLKKIVAGWEHGIVRQIDIGSAEGPWGKQHFLEGAGTGLVATAMPLLEKMSAADEHDYQEVADELHRDLSVYIAIAASMRPIGAKVTVEGKAPHEDDYLLFECLNIARAGPCIRLQPHADPGDGLLHVVALREPERPTLVRHLLEHLSKPGRMRVKSRAEKELVLRLTGGSFRADDQILWTSGARNNRNVEIKISVVPKAVQMMVPGKPGK